jgi:hypothetical protein
VENNFLDKLEYSYSTNEEHFNINTLLKSSLQLISSFFQTKNNHKLCLVFPTKEYVAQWLSIPLALNQIKKDFIINNKEIFEAYKKFNRGDKIIINNVAVVEWVAHTEKGIIFKTGEEKNASGAVHTIEYKNIEKLQPAPLKRQNLAVSHKARSALFKEITDPLDKLLEINSGGNRNYQMNSIVLVSKIYSFENSIEEIHLNDKPIEEFISVGKIVENGEVENKSPLLISKNLSNLALYLSQSDSISTLIIDGYSIINEKRIDFSDIDALKIPTVLITDLSEINIFETIDGYDFDFFNFTNENIKSSIPLINSPFFIFEEKVNNYLSFNFKKEIINHETLEKIEYNIQSIERDDSNNTLNLILVSLIQLLNMLSRIVHIPDIEELSFYNDKINKIESNYISNKYWIGQSSNLIESIISDLRMLISNFSTEHLPKYKKLKELLKEKKYDYIICPTTNEVKYLIDFFNKTFNSQKPKIISISDLTDELISGKKINAILTGWPKSVNFNYIISTFYFNELVALFYKYEYKYLNSLQRKNHKQISYVKPSINEIGNKIDIESKAEYEKLYQFGEINESTIDFNFDIDEFEIRLDNIQYSKYSAKGNLAESCKAKRIDFENDFFVYSMESHKFLIINDLIEKQKENANLYRRKVEALKSGHVIAFINTDRDILVELVENNTNKKELASVKQWTELWKNLLKEHYISIGSDFNKFVNDLRKYDCKKHEVTIKAWLQDESRIGPDDNSDLISIALLTNSNLLNDNIDIVREAIRKMKGWRMQASDFISDKIKSHIHEFADNSIINKTILVEGLGSVFVLKIVEVSNTWDNIDVRYVNRLLQKEII